MMNELMNSLTVSGDRSADSGGGAIARRCQTSQQHGRADSGIDGLALSQSAVGVHQAE